MRSGWKAFRYWGNNWLEFMMYSLAAALVMFLLESTGMVNEGGNKFLQEVLDHFPYFLIAGGAIILFMIGSSYFQVYFSVLVSMNCTRRSTVLRILCSMVSLILGILALCGVIWFISGSEEASQGLIWLPVAAGILLSVAASSVFLGTIMTRWGKIGAIIFVCFCLVGGFMLGVWMATGEFELFDGSFLQTMPGNLFGAVFVALGFLMFVAAGIFSAVVLRKMEIRS